MALKPDTILTFIREFYEIECYRTTPHSKNITIMFKLYRDEYVGEKLFLYNVMGHEINLLWNLGKHYTGVELYDKRWGEVLPGAIKHSLSHERTLDLIRTLLKEKIPCAIPLCEIPWEFPNLFKVNEGLESAVNRDKV